MADDGTAATPLTAETIRDAMRRLAEQPAYTPPLHEQFGATGFCLRCGVYHHAS
jgi:hypothetical protein